MTFFRSYCGCKARNYLASLVWQRTLTTAAEIPTAAMAINSTIGGLSNSCKYKRGDPVAIGGIYGNICAPYGIDSQFEHHSILLPRKLIPSYAPWQSIKF